MASIWASSHVRIRHIVLKSIIPPFPLPLLKSVFLEHGMTKMCASLREVTRKKAAKPFHK